jgi:hypothetical protein
MPLGTEATARSVAWDIYRHEGIGVFARGATARMMMLAPGEREDWGDRCGSDVCPHAGQGACQPLATRPFATLDLRPLLVGTQELP